MDLNKFTESVALIPARGGSKGIPKKNLIRIGDKSLLEIGIRKLKLANIEKIYVSSDNQAILELANNLGASPLTRPKSLANDEAGTEVVIQHFLESVELSSDQIILLHQITSPFITVESIAQSRDLLLRDERFNSIISLCFGHHFEWICDDDGQCEPSHHNRNLRPRRQDLGLIGFETGGIYAFRKKSFLDQRNRFPMPTGFVSVTKLESLDIDNQEDLDFARGVYENKLHSNRSIE